MGSVSSRRLYPLSPETLPGQGQEEASDMKEARQQSWWSLNPALAMHLVVEHVVPDAS